MFVGIPAWIWFVIAAVALVAGLGLLGADRAREGSRNRERMRWAQLRGWQFVEEDARLPQQWSGGALGYFGADAAVNVVAGSTFTSDGRRPVFIFDIETGGQIHEATAGSEPVVVYATFLAKPGTTNYLVPAEKPANC